MYKPFSFLDSIVDRFISVRGIPPVVTWHSSNELVPVISKDKLVKLFIKFNNSFWLNSLYFLFGLILDILIIISTNLDINDIFRIYEERIGSRIIGYYDIYRFFGEDLRFKRK